MASLVKDRILFWLSEELIYYFIAKSLQDKHACDFFAIIDATHEGAKKFFQKQQLVQFVQTWYYQDSVSISQNKPDISYLKSFEDKYKINIWEIAYSERFFYRDYNPYHKFTRDEILSIIEQECRFFESIIDKVKPSFLFTNIITRHHIYLLYKICQARNIKILSMENVNFGNKRIIAKTIGKIDDAKNYSQNNYESDRDFSGLQDYLNSFKPDKGSEYRPTLKISKLEKGKAMLHFFLSKRNEYDKNLYINYGKTKLKTIIYGSTKILSLKRRRRESFMNKKFKRDMDDKTPFIYFPLHAEPERDLLVSSPFYTSQIAVITNIAKSLPVEYKVYVKDHPSMVLIGWRSINYYKQIMNLPNVEIIHPSIGSEEIIKKCSMVITIAGTAGIEAAFYNKPSIVFSDMDYSALPSVYKLKKIEELPQAIRRCLQKEVQASELDKYVTFVDKNSFKFDLPRYISEFSNHFYYAGFSKEVDISTQKVQSFFDDHRLLFDELAVEHLKKIKQYEEKELGKGSDLTNES